MELTRAQLVGAVVLGCFILVTLFARWLLQ